MPLSLYIDESVPVAVVTGLQRRGVPAVSARDAGNLGLGDKTQLAYAIIHRLVIFTHDTDFLTSAHRYAETSEDHWGVIYVYQDKLTIGACIRRLKEIADLFEPEEFRNHIEFL